MVLNEFVYDPNSTANSVVINLVQGTVSFIAAQVAKTGNMRVETPTATMGIRGTFVTVSVSSVDGHTVASLGLETDASGRQYSGVFSLTNRITGNQVTVERRRQHVLRLAGGEHLRIVETSGDCGDRGGHVPGARAGHRRRREQPDRADGTRAGHEPESRADPRPEPK